jgi:hypothetical protein
MSGPAELSNRFMDAYNNQDFDTMASMMVPDIDFNHFNRDFPMNSRDALIDTLRTFAAQYFVERAFEKPEKLLVVGTLPYGSRGMAAFPRSTCPVLAMRAKNSA